MKQTRALIILTAVITMSAVFFLNSPVSADTQITKETLKTMSLEDRVSYAIGLDVYKQLKSSFNINPDLLLQGIKDSHAQQPKMTEEEIKETMLAFQDIARQKQVETRGKDAAKNKVLGKAFLEENKTKEGVIELPSGLQYKIITEGTGPLPKLEDKVKCHYKGTLVDGTVFDSSYQRNQPAVFPINGVIKGWTEALQLMKTGSKWMLYIPSDLGYGDNGAGEIIKPGAALIFEVELLAIEE